MVPPFGQGIHALRSLAIPVLPGVEAPVPSDTYYFNVVDVACVGHVVR